MCDCLIVRLLIDCVRGSAFVFDVLCVVPAVLLHGGLFVAA